MRGDEILALSRAASPDPFPLRMAAAGDRDWLYAPGGFARGMLDTVVDDGYAGAVDVGYDRNQRPPAARVRFRAADGAMVEAVSDDGGPACLVDDGRGWLVEHEGAWVEPDRRRGGGRPPHRDDEPVAVLRPAPLGDGLFDAGATVLARPVIRAAAPPRVRVGESIAEARAESGHEARVEVVRRDDGTWTTRARVGLRYLVVEGADEVVLEANARSVERPGAFACSDDALTRVWAVAAYTTRVCAQRLDVDGLKRDRMPWGGDLALNLLSHAYALGDGEATRDTLDALGRPDGYVNGIVDYSLWWVVSHAAHRLQFGDTVPLARRAADVAELLDGLSSDVDDDGVLRPRRPTGFPGGPVLIDWGVEWTPDRDLCALQMLFAWAARAGAGLLALAGHPRAAHWSGVAERAGAVLRTRGWDAGRGVWREHLEPGSGPSPYPNLLAVLAGVHDDIPASVADAIASRLDDVRTPFMTGFALTALITAGRPGAAVARIREKWLPMLDLGATTFWEEFPEEGRSPYEMYGRPFGKSLCHAWGAAPAALLPRAVLGIEPLEPGWSAARVAPALGDLVWGAAVVPTPLGDLVVHAERDIVTVDVPAGMRVTGLGDDVVGPTRVERRFAMEEGTA
ncbi:alpha-L-rhamnosidase-related protein [Microbacterium gilvum]|uniref:Alpha-L-rhamnosidase six-hairpin glycosidase domain-containing protein n=1 Tax=Microbacterium gilvum TaxID=1336204 RepID=A0ABP9AC80_9MICO